MVKLQTESKRPHGVTTGRIRVLPRAFLAMFLVVAAQAPGAEKEPDQRDVDPPGRGPAGRLTEFYRSRCTGEGPERGRFRSPGRAWGNAMDRFRKIQKSSRKRIAISGPPPAPWWIPVGPSGVRRGEATHQPAVSGRVRALVVKETTSGSIRVYAGCAGGGVWRSDDRGRSWINTIRPLRRELKNLRDTGKIEKSVYRKMYLRAKGGSFKSVATMNRYMREQKLIKK